MRRWMVVLILMMLGCGPVAMPPNVYCSGPWDQVVLPSGQVAYCIPDPTAFPPEQEGRPRCWAGHPVQQRDGTIPVCDGGSVQRHR